MSNTCRMCRHANRAHIDEAFQQGRPLRDIAGHFGPSRSALQRHQAHAHSASQAHGGREHDRELLLSLLQQAIAAQDAVIDGCLRRLPEAHADARPHQAAVLYQSMAQRGRLRAELARWQAEAPRPPR
jgi:hypothetical protein